MACAPLYIGTAGWSIGSRHAAALPPPGTHLERYARRLACVEVNSSFYRPHRPETYARWAASVPDGFRFCVKLPKAITHEKRLAGCEEDLALFLSQARCLGSRLGVILIQTPPHLAFWEAAVEAFLLLLRRETDVAVAFEPRHASWFGGASDAVFGAFDVARVAADPALFPGAGAPGGSRRLAYFRFHGAPRVYYSDYPREALRAIALRLRQARRVHGSVWCIFDNTAEGHALGNALALDGGGDDADPEA